MYLLTAMCVSKNTFSLHQSYINEPMQLQWAKMLHKHRHASPPMTWRGGLMWATPRKATLRLSPFNARALLYADHKPKHYSAAIHKLTVPFLQSVVQGNQSGAVKGGGTELACLLHVFFFEMQQLVVFQQGFCLAICEKAYYGVLLELALGLI